MKHVMKYHALEIRECVVHKKILNPGFPLPFPQ
jgi:hypothetical protein